MENVSRSFTVESCLGRGGFGEVYLATMTTNGGLARKVAVKVLHEGVSSHGQAVERLRDEGRMLAKLHHPSVLEVVDVTTLNHRVALITEFVDGQDLGDCVLAGLPARGQVEVMGSIAAALAAAWNDLGIVHRDVKPSNIRIGRHGEIKLLDFGIARTEQLTREANTATDMVLGSMPYMAPERFLEPDQVPASDVFALGATLFEGLTRRRYYGANAPVTFLLGLSSSRERYQEYLHEQITTLPDDLSQAVRDLLHDCLAHDPDKRPTACAVADTCELLAATVGPQSLVAWCRTRSWPGPPVAPGPWTGRTVTEGFTIEQRIGATPSVARPTTVAPPVRQRRPSFGMVLAGALLTSSGAAIVVTGVVIAGLGLLIRPPILEPAASFSEDVEQAAVEPAPELEPEAVAPEPVAPEPVAPEPVAAERVPVRARKAMPPPSPESSAAGSSGVVVATGALVELRGGGATYPAGSVPSGAYEAWADFGDGWVPAGQVEVGISQLRLACNPLLRSCEVIR